LKTDKDSFFPPFLLVLVLVQKATGCERRAAQLSHTGIMSGKRKRELNEMQRQLNEKERELKKGQSELEERQRTWKRLEREHNLVSMQEQISIMKRNIAEADFTTAEFAKKVIHPLVVI
jgi:septal ring factor EnvC (AmiA/AmiB activator)